MEIKSITYISYKNLTRRKTQVFFNILLISLTLVLFILTMSLMDSVNRFILSQTRDDAKFRTLNVYYNTDIIQSRNEVVENMKNVNHIIEAYPQSGVFGGKIINVTQISDNGKKDFIDLGIRACSNGNTPKVLAGSTFKKNDAKVGIIPKLFYPNSDFKISYSKENVDFIDGEKMIGKTIVIRYYAYDFSDEGQPKVVKSFDYHFKVVGVYDAVKNYDDPFCVYLPYRDVLNMQNNVEKYSKGLAKSVNNAVTAVVDKSQNTNKVIKKLNEIGYSANALSNANGSADQTSYIVIIGLILGMLLLILAFVVVSLTTISSIKKRTPEIGMLKAIGYTNKNITGIICFEMLLISIISLIIVLIICTIIFCFFTYLIKHSLTMYLQAFNPVINRLSIIVSIVIGILLPFFGCLSSIRRALEIEPTEALKSN